MPKPSTTIGGFGNQNAPFRECGAAYAIVTSYGEIRWPRERDKGEKHSPLIHIDSKHDFLPGSPMPMVILQRGEGS
jgi:hypothetical protein